MKCSASSGEVQSLGRSRSKRESPSRNLGGFLVFAGFSLWITKTTTAGSGGRFYLIEIKVGLERYFIVEPISRLASGRYG
jgi:hypothetical protein